MEEKIAENSGKIKVNELKIEALVKIMCEEGVMSREDFNKTFNRILENKEE
jgi:hypothetical protein